MNKPLFLALFLAVVVTASPASELAKNATSERSTKLDLNSGTFPCFDGLTGMIPTGFPCIPVWTMDYCLCQGGWCEPTICFNIFGGFWITSYDWVGFCTTRPASGQACVDKVPNLP